MADRIHESWVTRKPAAMASSPVWSCLLPMARRLPSCTPAQRGHAGTGTLARAGDGADADRSRRMKALILTLLLC